jgi:beta-aspartyl-peptidase (threonine type)
MTIAIIVHGGAWDIPAALHADHVAGCRAAAEAGWAILSSGGSALDAVEAAVRVMEDHPVFDAGRGSHLNRDGEVELDAGMMDGRTLMAGAVAAVKRVANPISLARRVLHDSEHVFLVGAGAERFAQQVGIPLCDPADPSTGSGQALVVEREREAWAARHAVEARTGGGISTGAAFRPGPADTVGAVALDAAGNLAVGNSTGGTFFKHPGRVGDTPIIGCGLYADNTLGAAACTGWGEQIMKTVLAKTTVDQIALLGNAPTAANVAIAYFQRRIGGLGGVICLAPDGQVGWAHSTPYMACAYRTAEMSEMVATIGHDMPRPEGSPKSPSGLPGDQ